MDFTTYLQFIKVSNCKVVKLERSRLWQLYNSWRKTCERGWWWRWQHHLRFAFLWSTFSLSLCWCQGIRICLEDYIYIYIYIYFDVFFLFLYSYFRVLLLWNFGFGDISLLNFIYSVKFLLVFSWVWLRHVFNGNTDQ